MKSIKYLLISIIIILAYNSNLPNSFEKLVIGDYFILGLFAINFYLGVSKNINEK